MDFVIKDEHFDNQLKRSHKKYSFKKKIDNKIHNPEECLSLLLKESLHKPN